MKVIIKEKDSFFSTKQKQNHTFIKDKKAVIYERMTITFIIVLIS